MSGDDGERRADEVLAPVPEHERFRRLEELQEDQEPEALPGERFGGEQFSEAED
jgi:hypothetical protein